MSDFLAHRSVSALRARYGDAADEASPALSPGPETSDLAPGTTRAGEALLTPGQKIALLKMRGSDWSKAILKHLTAFGQDEISGRDYVALANLGLAINKGTFHVLSPPGRWRADRVACELARGLDMHVMTLALAPKFGSAASAKCTCGWSTFRTRAVPSYATLIAGDAHHHLQNMGAL